MIISAIGVSYIKHGPQRCQTWTPIHIAIFFGSVKMWDISIPMNSHIWFQSNPSIPKSWSGQGWMQGQHHQYPPKDRQPQLMRTIYCSRWDILIPINSHIWFQSVPSISQSWSRQGTMQGQHHQYPPKDRQHQIIRIYCSRWDISTLIMNIAINKRTPLYYNNAISLEDT